MSTVSLGSDALGRGAWSGSQVTPLVSLKLALNPPSQHVLASPDCSALARWSSRVAGDAGWSGWPQLAAPFRPAHLPALPRQRSYAHQAPRRAHRVGV